MIQARDMVDFPTVRTARGYSATLALYLSSRWMLVLLMTLAALASFVYLIDLIDLLREVAGKGVPVTYSATMSLMKLPNLMLQLLPFAVLIASLIWLNQLNHSQELVALRASGLPARRIVMGPVMACLALGVSALVVINPVSAVFLKRFESWRADVFPGTVQGVLTSGGSVWLRQDQDMAGERRTYFIHGRNVAADGTSLGATSVFIFTGVGDFVARMDADQARLRPGFWRLENTFMLSPKKKIVHEDAVDLPTRMTAEQIQSSFNPPATLNVLELREFITILRKSGLPAERHAMALQKLYALPATCLAMLLLAVPFGLTFTRGRGVATVVLAGLGLGFGFYLLGNFVAAYGMAGRLNVMLAAWIPALIAMLMAAALLIHLREE